MKPNSYIRTVLTLLLICSVCGGLVAGVSALTSDRIRINEQNKTASTIVQIFPEAATLSSVPVPVEGGSVKELVCYQDDSLSSVAYAATVAPKGFQDSIRMCVVVSCEGVVLGVRILSASETPGLGEKVCEAEYLDAYRDLSGPITFGNGVDAVSGATVSSRAVLNGVNEVLRLVETIEEKGEAW